MSDQNLDNLIERAKRAPMPECPDTLELNVLRRIRLAGRGSEQSLLDWVVDLLPQPGVILTAVAVAVTVSSGITIGAHQSQTAIQHSRTLASAALGFEVFQSNEILNLDDR